MRFSLSELWNINESNSTRLTNTFFTSRLSTLGWSCGSIWGRTRRRGDDELNTEKCVNESSVDRVSGHFSGFFSDYITVFVVGHLFTCPRLCVSRLIIALHARNIFKNSFREPIMSKHSHDHLKQRKKVLTFDHIQSSASAVRSTRERTSEQQSTMMEWRKKKVQVHQASWMNPKRAILLRSPFLLFSAKAEKQEKKDFLLLVWLRLPSQSLALLFPLLPSPSSPLRACFFFLLM